MGLAARALKKFMSGRNLPSQVLPFRTTRTEGCASRWFCLEFLLPLPKCGGRNNRRIAPHDMKERTLQWCALSGTSNLSRSIQYLSSISVDSEALQRNET